MLRLRPQHAGALATLGTILSLTGPARASDIVFLSDGAEATIKSALAAAPATGTLVLVVPPGEWVYTGTVGIGRADTVLIGTGPSLSRFYRTGEETAALIQPAKVSNIRIAELRVDGNAAASSASTGVGVRMNDVVDFRVDHCALAEHGASGVRSSGTSQGVVDHSDFNHIYKPPIANLGYGVVVYGDGTIGNVPFGSDKATFIEDSTFADTRHAVASNNGARYVFRHNDVRKNVVGHAIDAHGFEYGSTVGTEWVDVNNNVVADPVYTGTAVRIRGGKGVVWSNTISGYTYGVTLTEQTPQATGPVYIWGNTVSGTLLNAGAGTSSQLAAPAGYKGYTYPHPLVTALTSSAGPDMRAMVTASGDVEVYVDGSASKAGTGSVVAHRWMDATGTLSTCARDVLRLGPGSHVLLLETERTDGRVAHDTALVEVIASGPLKSSASFESLWFRPIVGKGTVSFTLVPSAAAMDGYVALTGRHAVAGHDDNAVIIRANNTGKFDARDGTAYAAVNDIPYVAGKSYQVSVQIDVAAQTYDATVDGVTLAQGYAFRSKETSIGQAVACADVGSVSASDIAFSGALAEPDAPCATQPDAGAGGAGGGAAGSAGSPPSAGSGGSVSGSDAGSAASAGAGGSSAAPGDAEGGCGCGIASRGLPLGLFGALALGALAWARRRRG